MAPKSKTVPLWNPYGTFDVFPNTGSFQCLDSRCLDLVDGEDTKAACARLDKMALKDPSGIGEKSLARLAVLCFCSRHREDPRHEGEILGKVSEWQERIEDVLEESDKESEGEMEEEQEYESGKESEGEMEETQEGEREVIQLLDEVIELKEQLQRTVDENGMLQQQIAADEQRSRKKQTKMSKKITQLQRQVSEVEGTKDDVELAKTVHAREKERLEKELERIQEIAACSREVEIKEVNELKVQLQDRGAQVEEAAGHIEDLKGQLEESITRIESLKRATSEDIREFKSQLDRERGLTMELTELTSQLKESNTRLEESNTRLKEDNTCLDESNTHLEEINTSLRESNTYFEEESNRLKEINTNLGKSSTRLEERNTCLENSNTHLEESNTRLEESKSHHEVMERQTIAEIKKLRDQLDKSNTSLGDVRQGSIREASELRDQLTRCENIIAELKAAESANIGQCEANKSNNVLEVCQTENACDVAGSQQSTDSDDAVEAPMAASSLEENQSTEGDHGLKENLCDGKAASTMPIFVLHTEFHNLRMWRQFSLCGSYVDILFNQRKVEQVGIANPALLDEVLRLRKQARDVDRRLASQIEKISVLKPGDVNQGVETL